MVDILRLLDMNLVYTTTGQEFLTPEHLQTEIRSLLLEHKGRLQVGEIPDLLMVDLAAVDRAIDALKG